MGVSLGGRGGASIEIERMLGLVLLVVSPFYVFGRFIKSS